MRVRTVVWSLALLVFTVSSMQAQSTQSMSFGVVLGGTAAKFSGLDLKAEDFLGGTSTAGQRMGLQAGVYVNKPLMGRLSLQPEVHYVQKGAEFDGRSGDNLKLTFALTYVEVPVLLRADFGSGAIHPFVIAGPSFSYRAGCKATIASASASLGLQCEDIDSNGTKRDPFKSSDIGAAVGVGLAASLGGRTITSQLRYGKGFTSIATDEATANSSADQSPKNSVISLVFSFGR